jgi:CPA1 family monovalent cation:H+ antiporter
MSLLLVISVLLVLTAIFAVVNERYLRMQPSIGLMLLALLMSLVFLGLKSAGIVAGLGLADPIFRELSFSSVLLNGVLCRGSKRSSTASPYSTMASASSCSRSR